MIQKSFNDISDNEGLVLLGCGGNLEEWESGVINILSTENIANKSDFTEAFSLITTGGRIDLVLPFSAENKINIGKLAIWRLTFGDCSWISDYLVNYRSHHGLLADGKEVIHTPDF